VLMKFLAVPDTNNLIVNTELTKIKVTVVINLKWPNLDYPSCHLVGRPHLTFPVTTKRHIPGVEFVFKTTRIGRLYVQPDNINTNTSVFTYFVRTRRKITSIRTVRFQSLSIM
jgi:hypothetical protein